MSYLCVTSGRVATTTSTPDVNITINPTNIPIAYIVTPMGNLASTPMSTPLPSRVSCGESSDKGRVEKNEKWKKHFV
jgi:hypothetical protein